MDCEISPIDKEQFLLLLILLILLILLLLIIICIAIFWIFPFQFISPSYLGTSVYSSPGFDAKDETIGQTIKHFKIRENQFETSGQIIQSRQERI